MNLLKGTGVALVTPFNADLSIDHKSLRKLTRHVIDGGVDFLVILGTTGESATLDREEQFAVVDTVLEANGGEVPYVIGCGGNDTRKIKASMADFSSRYAPAAFLSVSPYYNKPSQEGIYQHFKTLSEASSYPILLYNVPGRTSSNMLPSTSLRLARDFDNIFAIKEACGDIEQGMDLIQGKPESFSVLSGDDTLTLAQLATGFDGVISVAANALPTQFSGMVRAGRQGDFARGRELNYEILKLMRLFFAEGNPSSIKLALEHLGICERHVRQPMYPGSDALFQQIGKALAELG